MQLESKRLILRPFIEADVQPLADISADPEVMQYIGGGVQTYEHIKKRVKYFIESYEKKNYSLFAIIEKVSQQFIGFCGLIDQTIEDVPYIELGYRLARSHWNRNIGTEAAYIVKDFAFNTLRIPEIISIIQPENKASIRVAEKIGMKPKMEIIFHGCPVILYHQLNPALIVHKYNQHV